MDQHDRNVIFSHKTDIHSTPKDLYERLNAVHHFTLDPASNDDNFLCPKHYTEKEDGLSQSWVNEIIFCNPQTS